MAQYFLASINSSPSPDDAESISMKLAMIERQCKIINRLEPLGRMNYSRVSSYEENHWDLVEIARLCIQFEKHGKLEEVKDLLLSIKQELVSKSDSHKAGFDNNDQLLKDASFGKLKSQIKLDQIFSEKD